MEGEDPLEGAKAGLGDVSWPALFGLHPPSLSHPHPPVLPPPSLSPPALPLSSLLLRLFRALQEFPSSSHYSEKTAGDAPLSHS